LPIADFRLARNQGRLFHRQYYDADDLKKRTKQFALRILKLVAALPNTIAGRAIGGQLVRAGTSVGANYRTAFRGRSKAEVVAKLGISEEEADESGYWMEMIEGQLLKRRQVEPLLNEANELTRILAQSRISASRALARTFKQEPSNRQSAIGNRQ